MTDLLHMNGHGIYVWASYAITLGVIVLNIWLARSMHARNLAIARAAMNEPEAPRRPNVRQVQ
jgi:heme exporter protein CcmD